MKYSPVTIRHLLSLLHFQQHSCRLVAALPSVDKCRKHHTWQKVSAHSFPVTPCKGKNDILCKGYRLLCVSLQSCSIVLQPGNVCTFDSEPAVSLRIQLM